MTEPKRTPCPRCRQVHERCSSHKKRRDGDGNLVPCGQHPIAGIDRCRMHAGKTTEAAKAEGQRRLALGRAIGEAGKMIDAMGGVRAGDADPLSTLLEAVALTRAMMLVFADLVSGLDVRGSVAVHGDGRGAVLEVLAEGVVGADRFGELTAHPYVELLGTWTERAARVSKDALGAGIDERQMQVAEDQARIMATAFRALVLGFAAALVAAGIDEALVQRIVHEQSPALMRKAIEQARKPEPGRR